ncbi:unnamed protein product [Sphagnum balticum]
MTETRSKAARPPRYVMLQKERGETPLETLSKWKVANPEFAEVPASYAGRLDPMAEGKLLVLLGEECKKQAAYTKLDKEYEIEVLLDLKTDSGDVLGLVAQQHTSANRFLNTNETNSNSHRSAPLVPSAKELQTVLKHEIGRHSRRYPVFSSKTVSGKPLFLYALEGTLNTIQVPQHIETIYTIKLLKTEKVSTQELQKRIEQLLSKVPRSDEPSKLLGADFRQDAVRAEWQKLFATLPAKQFTILKLRVICGSGSYMRTLAERIGMSLGSTALALSINRTKIGHYVSLGLVSFWSKKY